MATTKNNQQRRRSSQRSRGPRHVEPVLDPTWKSPYAPTSEEREANSALIGRWSPALLGETGIVAVLAIVTVVIGLVPIYISLAVIVACAAFIAIQARKIQSRKEAAHGLAGELVAAFPVCGTKTDRVRLSTVVERLSATFGLSDINCFVVEESVPNATMVVDGEGYTLIVTTGLMTDVELIELEGVVAHCMARQRLGYLALPAMLASATLRPSERAKFVDLLRTWAFRADEVAAAMIRYPLGLQRALERTSATVVPANSYFASEAYARARWIWFDQHIDGQELITGDVGEAKTRAQALEEW